LKAAEMCEETQVFLKLNLLTNHSRPALDMQITMPRVNNLRRRRRRREKQKENKNFVLFHAYLLRSKNTLCT